MTCHSYVIVNHDDPSPEPGDLEGELWPADTVPEILAAKEALRSAGLDSAPVWHVDPEAGTDWPSGLVLAAGG